MAKQSHKARVSLQANKIWSLLNVKKKRVKFVWR